MEKRRSDTMKIARDLRYPKEVIEELRKARSESELTRIMITARHKAIKEDRW